VLWFVKPYLAAGEHIGKCSPAQPGDRYL